MSDVAGTETGPGPDEPVGPAPQDRRGSTMDAIAETRIAMLAEDGVVIEREEPEPGEPAAAEPELGAAAESGSEPGPEAGEEPEPAPGPEPEPGEAPATPVQDPATEPAAEPAAEAREPLPGEPLYTVKVDGVERQVPLSELTASFQIQSAAQNRLETANQVLGRVREMEARGTTQPGTPVEPAGTPGDPATADPTKIDYGELAEALQYGDKDVAKAALEKTVGRIMENGAGSQDPAVAVAQIESQVLEKVEWSTALTRFYDEFSDILSDKYVSNVAGSISRQLYQQAFQEAQANGTPRPPYWEILKNAGDQTRTWLEGLSQPQAEEPAPEPPTDGAQPTVNLSPERTARKSAAPKPPTPRSAQPSVRPAQTKEPTEEERASAAIREKQEKRGQIVA